MSGGVDSSVAALLLQHRGFDLVGLFMRNGVHVSAGEEVKKSCCSVSDARDARMVAGSLGIPFQAVDLKQEFKEVIAYFLRQYAQGLTPNPCAVCNRDLKFHRLLAFARELGAQGVATGHYARRDTLAGRVRLRRAIDPTKDQSYQMFCVAEDDLARAHFPLGELLKSQVRAVAAEHGLKTAAKADSQEICFVPSNNYRSLFDERGLELHKGPLVDTSGSVLGEHEGIELFTVGQRRGHGIGGGEPLYVVEVDPKSSRVVLGTRDECGGVHMQVGELNWIGFDPPRASSWRADVQIRYHHRAAPACVTLDGECARVEFDQPQTSIAPGQGAAFFQGEQLLGGGWIERDTKHPR